LGTVLATGHFGDGDGDGDGDGNGGGNGNGNGNEPSAWKAGLRVRAVRRLRMSRVRLAGLCAAAGLVLVFAGCGSEQPDAEDDKVSFGEHDLVDSSSDQTQVSPGDGGELTEPVETREEDNDHSPQLPVCGDGKCQANETAMTCAQDCQQKKETAAFVFAHKGDELGALGRIRDLVLSGAGVYVFYVTFDDTPLAEKYGDSTSKLSVASLGVPAANIYTYEKYIKWGLVTGNHEVLDRLIQHLGTLKPDTIYLPQLCGGDLESELAHVIGVWAAKNAVLTPAFMEVPARSSYYALEDPDPASAQANPDAFVDQFIKRWKLIPKSSPEITPTLGGQDVADIRLASAHIQDSWWQDVLYKVPEDRVLYLLRTLQTYREVPENQKTDEKPYLNSIPNPQGTYIYNEQGYTFDEYRQMAWVVESFFGTNVRSNPSSIPFYDDGVQLKIKTEFDVVLELKSFSAEPDVLSFTSAFGPSKQPSKDCQPVDDLPVDALATAQAIVHCKAEEPIGAHTYYFRVYSKKAEEYNDAAKFTELPFVVKIGVK